MTTKGELVRSILFPPPLDFKFNRDFLRSIYVFLFLGLVGMSYSIYMWNKKGVGLWFLQLLRFNTIYYRMKTIFCNVGWDDVGNFYVIFLQGTFRETLLNSLDILTFVVPPILPAALTANNAFAQKRLEKKGIYCLHSKHISLCGGIDICAFDKVCVT